MTNKDGKFPEKHNKNELNGNIYCAKFKLVKLVEKRMGSVKVFNMTLDITLHA
jgi:hypothetical protein